MAKIGWLCVETAVLISVCLLVLLGDQGYDVYTYVSDYWQHSIVIVKNFSITDHIELPGSTTNSVDITPDNTRLYATNGLEGISVIDVSPSSKSYRKIIANVRTSRISSGVRIHPDGTKVYVASDKFIHVVDCNPDSETYNTVIKTIALPRYAFDLDFSPGGDLLFVAFQEAPPGNVAVIDTGEDELVDVDEDPSNGVTCMSVGQFVGGSIWFKALRISQYGFAYLLNSGELSKGYGHGNTISIFDTATLQPVDVEKGASATSAKNNEGSTSIDLPGILPVSLWFSPDNNRLYVCQRETISDASGPRGKLVVIDTNPASSKFNQIIKIREAGFRPEAVGVWPDGRYILVSCRGEHQVRVFDRNLNPVTTIPVNYPGQMVSVRRSMNRNAN
jgi:DNA-binding beta-propeller fold protein YncE